MREGYGNRFVCLSVYLCVCYHASGYIPGLYMYVQSEVAYSFLYAFKDMHCVDFAEDVSFGRYGIICLPRWSATWLFLDKSTPMVLDTITNGIVYELLARSDDYLN